MTAPAGWYPDPNAPRTHRWWDGGQWTPHTAPGYGPDPARDLEGEARAGEHARTALFVTPALWIGDYLVIALIFGDVWHQLRRRFDLIRNGDHPNSYSAVSLHDTLLLNLVGLLLLVGQILFLVWLYRAAEVGQRAGIPARHAPGWAIAGFVVPVVNFWFPYQSAADLFPVGHPDRRLAGQWWTWYLIQSGLVLPVMITAYFSTAAAVILALVFAVAPVLAAQTGRRLIAGANRAHAQHVQQAA